MCHGTSHLAALDAALAIFSAFVLLQPLRSSEPLPLPAREVHSHAGSSWGETYQDYLRQGVVAPNDAYSSLGGETGESFAASASRSKARQWRWTRLSSAIYDGWEQRPQPDGRVVAVVSTTPARISALRPSLDSVLTQSFPMNVVYVFVPFQFQRTGERYVIPSWLQMYNDSGRVTLVRSDDLGPGTAVYAVLAIETVPSTVIFKVDDDQYYGPNTLLMLLRGSEVLPGRALTTDTTQIYPHAGGVILQGVHGLLLRRGFFDDSIFHFERAAGRHFRRSCWLHDDLWMTMHLAKKGIQRESLELRQGSRVLEVAFGADALHRGGAGTDNYENFYLCNAAALRSSPELWSRKQRVVLLTSGVDALDLYSILGLLSMQTTTPQEVYVCGARGWDAFHHGSWLDGYVVTPLPGCNRSTTLHGLVEFVAKLERDPSTVMIASIEEILGMPTLIQILADCVAQNKLEEGTARTYCSVPRAYNRDQFAAVAVWRGRLSLAGEHLLSPAFDAPLFDIRDVASAHRAGCPSPLPAHAESRPRVALFVLPLSSPELEALPHAERLEFEEHLAGHNLDLLAAQSLMPSAAYIFSAGVACEDLGV